MSRLYLTIPLLLLLFSTACTTTQLTNAAKWAPVAQIAAKDGTYLALRQNPSLRPGFEQAVVNLRTLEASPQVDFAQLMQIVQSFPIKELKGDTAALIISDATIIVQSFAPGEGVVIGPEQTAQLRVLVTAIRAGVEAGLQLSAPTINPLNLWQFVQ